ncbi:heparan sulfate glucosamine 3-o-sulfotransferase 5 [Plakobranchus ocellatus]|uniref:Heparan sulfate glucosamine 3-o-sulfotransferase 5 n=1 Tax=Plakobranchus ocellatus TaxID=259542 RepID=A0AAV3YXR3_9GAST|nr:heparan sulfate glucosamine 3-o-sulfotransferase 5 [Plakobranchus ocellatus]
MKIINCRSLSGGSDVTSCCFSCWVNGVHQPLTDRPSFALRRETTTSPVHYLWTCPPRRPRTNPLITANTRGGNHGQPADFQIVASANQATVDVNGGGRVDATRLRETTLCARTSPSHSLALFPLLLLPPPLYH